MVNKETLQTLTNYINTPIAEDFCKKTFVPGERIVYENGVVFPTSDRHVTNPLPKGMNLDFIVCYLYVHGPSKASDILKALKTRNRVPLTHEYRSHYGTYFYGDGYRNHRWARHFDGDSEQPCVSPLWEQHKARGPWSLTPLGLKRVADFLAK
jgi:hypothetical protein